MRKKISIILALSMVLSLFSIVAQAADTDVYFDITYQTTDGTALDTTALKEGDTFYAVVSLAGEYDKVAGAMIALSWNNSVIAPVKANLTDDATTFGTATTARLDNNSSLKYILEVEDPDSGEMVESSVQTFKQAGTALTFADNRGYIKYNVTANTDVVQASGEGAFDIGNNPVMKIRFIVKGKGDADLKVNASETIKIGAFNGDIKKEYVQTDALSLVDIATLEVGSAEEEVTYDPQNFVASFVAGGSKFNGNNGLTFNFKSEKDDVVSKASYPFAYDELFGSGVSFTEPINVTVGVVVNKVPSDVKLSLESAEWCEEVVK